MMRMIANPKTAVAVIVSLLALNLPSLNLLKSQASGKTASQQNLIGPEVFEQKDSFGEVLTRLRVSPAELPNSYEFQVQDVRNLGDAAGTVEIGSGIIKFRLTDARTKTRVGVDIRPDQTPGKARVTISLNKKSADLAIDGAKAREVGARIQRLVDQGKQDQVKGLMTELGATISGQEQYVALAKRVANSPAFGILSAAASLKASLTLDSVHKNPALHVIGLGVSLLAPAGAKKAGHSSPTQASRAQQSRFVNNFAGVKPAQEGVCDCCYGCIGFLIGMIFACSDFYFWCLGWADPWVCDILGSLCLLAGYEAAAWCWNNQCGFACGDLC